MKLSDLWLPFRSWLLSFGVRVKIMGIAMGVILLLGLVVTIQVRATMKAALREELRRRGTSIARDIAGRAADLILTNNLFALNELVRDAVETDLDVRYVFAVDQAMAPLAHTFVQGIPAQLLDANALLPGEQSRIEILDTEEGLIHDVAVPILEGKVGTVRVGMSERRLLGAVASITRFLLLVTGLVSLASVGGAYVLTSVMTRPILDLVKATEAVGRGDFTRKARLWAMDEIGQLGVAFNAMTEALARFRADVEEVNRRLLRRNEELSALNALAATASRSLKLEEVLDGALGRVLEVLRLQAGWIFLQDGRSGSLVLAAYKGLSADFFEEQSEQYSGKCTCREVMASGEARVIDDVRHCPLLSRAAVEKRSFSAHAGVPLKAKDRALGIMNVACEGEHRFGEEDLRLLTSIGHQIGMAVENARLYEEVRRKEEGRRLLLDKLIIAQEEERRRIARELHDEVGQSLTALIMGLGGVEETIPPGLEQLRRHLEDIRTQTARTLEETRRLMVDLRPSILDDLGLIPAICWYAETYLPLAGVAPRIEVVGSKRRLSASVETALFRVVQEAITNIARHAEAREATIRVAFEASSVAVSIEDDGKGFDPGKRRREHALGLLGMEERITLLGGALTIDSLPGRGTRIVLEIPIEGEA